MTNANLAACRRVEARLAGLVDGALAPLDAARDRGHLEACAPCRRALAHHEHLLVSIRAAARAGTEHDVVQQDVEFVAVAVRARLGELAPTPEYAPTRPRSPRRWAVGLAAAAAAVLLLALLESRADFSLAAHPGQRVLAQARTQLPSWSSVVRGLGSLSRGLSGGT